MGMKKLRRRFKADSRTGRWLKWHRFKTIARSSVPDYEPSGDAQPARLTGI